MSKAQELLSMVEGDMTRQYAGFVILNDVTKKQTKYPYIKGKDSKFVEDSAIAEQMRLTGQPREDFSVFDFVQKGGFFGESAHAGEKKCPKCGEMEKESEFVGDKCKYCSGKSEALVVNKKYKFNTTYKGFTIYSSNKNYTDIEIYDSKDVLVHTGIGMGLEKIKADLDYSMETGRSRWGHPYRFKKPLSAYSEAASKFKAGDQVKAEHLTGVYTVEDAANDKVWLKNHTGYILADKLTLVKEKSEGVKVPTGISDKRYKGCTIHTIELPSGKFDYSVWQNSEGGKEISNQKTHLLADSEAEAISFGKIAVDNFLKSGKTESVAERLLALCEGSARFIAGSTVRIFWPGHGFVTKVIKEREAGSNWFIIKDYPAKVRLQDLQEWNPEMTEAAGKPITILFNKEYKEYRCPGPKGTEAQAYYTNDLEDAKVTLVSEWKRAGITVDPADIKVKKVDEWPKGMGN